MLAQNFKTHDDLQLPAEEYEALIKVLGMLERDELKHVHKPPLDLYYASSDVNGDCFNMSTTQQKYSCGTVACIGGWVNVLLGKPPLFGVIGLEDNCADNPHLQDLYFPPVAKDSTVRYGLITPAMAALALRNYLTLGEPRWEDVVSW